MVVCDMGLVGTCFESCGNQLSWLVLCSFYSVTPGRSLSWNRNYSHILSISCLTIILPHNL